jgi:hypothetical protein
MATEIDSLNKENKMDKKWNTDHMPEGYPGQCNTDLLEKVIQDLNDEYVTGIKAGRNNQFWEKIILHFIELGKEELQKREKVEPKPEKNSRKKQLVSGIPNAILISISLFLVIVVICVLVAIKFPNKIEKIGASFKGLDFFIETK